MNSDLLQEILSYLILLPAALTCLFPMKNKMKYSWKINVFHVCLFVMGFIFLAIFVDNNFDTSYISIFLPILIFAFLAYHYSLKVHISKSISVLLYTTAIFSFTCNFANGIDAALHPTGDINHISFEATVIRLIFGFIAMILLYYPMSKYGSFLIDEYDNPKVWLGTSFISIVFLTINLIFVPHYYETLHFHNVALTYWGVLSLCLLTLIALSITFYFIVRGFLDTIKIREQNIILSQQKDAFILQQKYLEESAKTRHDFRQSIHVLKGLADDGDLYEIQKYLEKYEESLPENKTKLFCKNPALNAVLNFYNLKAEENAIKTNFVFSIPEELPIDETDLCSVVGNILENAISAASKVPSEKRFINLNISFLYDSELYIVSSNSCENKSKKWIQHSDRNEENDFSAYQIPTGLKGSGTGLKSIKATAEYYGGSASFFVKDNAFYVNVMLKGNCIPYSSSLQ